jgi:hypothetical protein
VSFGIAPWGPTPVVFTGAGTAIVNGSGGGGHLSSLQLVGGSFATTGLVVPVTDPGSAPIQGFNATLANGPGAFSDGPSFGGVMPLIGALKVCLFGPCASAVANLTVPLSVVGVGGYANVTAINNFTVYGAPWTTGTVTIGTTTVMGGGRGPASNTGDVSGAVSLVTPIYIQNNTGPGDPVYAFAYLNLHFVPEPGTLTLLGAGIASLVYFAASTHKRG